MAAGWVTVLQMVPWGEVIKNAPKVADGAVKLWNSVSKKRPADGSTSDITDVVLTTDEQTVQKLEYQLQLMQVAVSELQTQVLQSAELIKELAGQNAQLVTQIETNRKAVTVLGVALALAIFVGVIQALVLFSA